MCSDQPRVYNSLNKYGFENHLFEVVHELPEDIEQKILDDYETFYWQQYKDCGVEMLNVKAPGYGGKHSEESKKKMSDLMNLRYANGWKPTRPKGLWGADNPSFGKPRSEECNRKTGEGNKKRMAEWKENDPEKWNALIERSRANRTGKKHSEETKKKMSEDRKGKKKNPHKVPTSDETRLKLSIAAKKDWERRKQQK